MQEFDWVVLRTGKPHLEMNMAHHFIDLIWDIFLSKLRSIWVGSDHHKTIGAVTRGTLTVGIALLPRETVFTSVTDVSRGKFPVFNIHGYVKKITQSAQDIYRGKLQWCFDAQGTKANHNAPFDSNT